MLLAKCLAAAPSKWQQNYVELVRSPMGEYIQTAEGEKLLQKLLKSRVAEPAAWRSQSRQLVILDEAACSQVIQSCRGHCTEPVWILQLHVCFQTQADMVAITTRRFPSWLWHYPPWQ